MLNRSRCIVLVPVYDSVERACEQSLQQLEERGYKVRRVWGGAAIDVTRNRMATQALDDGYEELMWIDSDVGFPVDAVDQLRDHDLPIVAGVYPKKAQSALAFHATGLSAIRFGEDAGGLVEIGFASAGFLFTRRAVYEDVQRICELPMCNQTFDDRLVPYFMPQVIHDPPDRFWYLAEDFSFSYRARKAGYKVFVDTTFRLWHIGKYAYSWEDSCGDRQRFAQFTMTCNPLDRPGLQTDAGLPEPWRPKGRGER